MPSFSSGNPSDCALLANFKARGEVEQWKGVIRSSDMPGRVLVERRTHLAAQ